MVVKASLNAPLAHRKGAVVCVAMLVAAFFIFRAASYNMGLPTFFAVGLGLNAGLVFGVVLCFYPLASIAVSVLLILMYSFVGSLGYWLLGISLTVYFLTASQARNQGNKKC